MAKTGSFDLNFPGAKLICDTPQKRASLLRYLNGQAQSIDVPLSNSIFEQDVDHALYNTTYIHESRHFHDHLLCPLLLHNYTLKIFAFYNLLVATHIWIKGNQPYKYIPTPFCDWLELPQKEKLELIEKKKISISDVPVFSLEEARLIAFGKIKCEDEFTKYLLRGAANYWEYKINSQEYVPDEYAKGYQIRNFCESMAFNVQIEEILRLYGDYGKLIYDRIIECNWRIFDSSGRLKKINEGDEPGDITEFSTYMAPYWLVSELCRESNATEYYYLFQSYILFWTLCGPLSSNGLPEIQPLKRLMTLISLEHDKKTFHLDKKSVLDELYDYPIRTFKKWNSYCVKSLHKENKHYPYYLRALNLEKPLPSTFKEFYNLYISKIMGVVNHLESLGVEGPAFYIYKLAQALNRMKGVFCEMPALYLYPDAYAQHMDLFVNVPFRFEFDNIEPIRKEECTDPVRLRKGGIAFINNYVYGDGFYCTDRPDIVDWIAYEAYSEIINYCDALYGVSNINMPGTIIKKHLQGIKPWFINV